jgi:hypothetical protein
MLYRSASCSNTVVTALALMLMLIFHQKQQTVGQDKFMGAAIVNIVDWIAGGGFRGDVQLTDKGGATVGKVT